MTVARKTVLLIAWPIILSNISTPLLGLVDTAVIGNLGDPALIGAIAVGAMIFSFLFWGFGFLRMGTTGLVAQARGAGEDNQVRAAYYRALMLAIPIGLILITMQSPIAAAAFGAISGSTEVETAALEYFRIRIWAAPLSLAHLAVLGYLLGHQKSGTILGLQLLLNGTNIGLDLLFVVGFGWGVAGIAAATLIAEAMAAIVGLVLVHKHMQQNLGTAGIPLPLIRDIPALARTLAVNRDIMIRTLCLIFAFAWFTNQGAKAGDVLLASNAILMQLVSFSAFFLDGYALAAESLVGTAVGARNNRQLELTLRYITELGLVTACGLSLIFFMLGPSIIDLLTTSADVRTTSREYLGWAIAAPLVSLWCYLLDGVFIGATSTREMRNAMIVSLVAYLIAWYLLTATFTNHGLWLSLHIYFIARAVTLYLYLPQVRKLTHHQETA